MTSPSVNKWVITLSVMSGTVMAVLDSSIVNVALPNMSGTLGSTIEEITWVVTGYMLSNVIIMPIIGMLSSRFGRKNLYLTSVVLFTVASMLCGLARTLPLLVLFRVIQGVGGGVLMTVSQAILRETFPAEEQGLAMGIYGMGVVLAPAFGPTVGGWLTDQYSWPWIFYINLPVGIVSAFMVQRFIHDPPYLERTRGQIDYAGVGLLMVGLGALQLALEQGQRRDWFDSSFIVTLFAIAAGSLAIFVWHELRTPRPAVELRVLKNLPFASATAIGGVLGMGLFGSLFLLPLFLQNLLGYPAMESGMALMPRSLAMAVVMPLGGLIYQRVGPRALVTAGLFVSAFSFWELSHLTSDLGFWDILLPQMWQGVGFSLIFLALSTAAFSTIPRPQITGAAGLYNVVRQVFGSIGIAVAANQLTVGVTRYHSILAERVSAYDPATRGMLGATAGGMQRFGADAFTAMMRAVRLIDLRVLRQATVLSYNHVFWLVAVLFALALPLVFLVQGTGEPSGEMMAE
jgi:DHA2 family multidrug resistance protein